MPQAFVTFRDLPSNPTSSAKLFDKCYPSAALAAARAAAETGVSALSGQIEIPTHLAAGLSVVDVVSRQWRVRGLADLAAADQARQRVYTRHLDE